MTFAILTLFALAGLITIVRGLRGQRVGDEPRCRRCDYDLTGAAADSTACPECGADVRAPRAIVHGVRRRRVAPLAVGPCLVLLAVLGFIGLAADVDWRGKLPTAYLLWEASRSGAAAARGDAIARLISRDATLTAAQRVALARAIVAIQRDPGTPASWQPSQWVAGQVTATPGRLPADVVQTFFENLLADVGVTLRPVIRQGERPGLRIASGVTRGGLVSASLAGVRADYSMRDRTLTIDGVAAGPTSGDVEGGMQIEGGGKQSSVGDERSDAWRTLAPDAHAVEWTLPAKIYAGAFRPNDTRNLPPPLATVTLRWAGTVTVVPRDDGDGDIRRVPNPALADAIAAAITQPKIRLSDETSGDYSSAILDVTFGAMPVDVAFEVLARQGEDTEQALTSFARSSAARSGGHGMHMRRPALVPGTCELIFRTKVDAARSTIDVFEIWDGEVRIANVPVVQDEPWRAPAPATTRSSNGSE